MKRVAFLLALVLLLPVQQPARAASKNEIVEEWTEGRTGSKIHSWKNGRKLVKSEEDTDKDGKPDIFRDYNDRGWPTASRMDTDHDGKLDRWATYNYRGVVVQEAFDSDKDEKPDVWVSYPDGPRTEYLREADRNGDGKIDWRSFGLIDKSKGRNRTPKIDFDAAALKGPHPAGKEKKPVDPKAGNRRSIGHIVWEEKDDDYDGVIDYYFNEKEPKKDLRGKKIDVRRAKAQVVFDASKSDRRKEPKSLADKMNERYNY